MSNLRRILCLTDFGKCARGALEQALLLAHANDAAIDLLHVVSVPSHDLLGKLGGGAKKPLSEIALEQCTARMSTLLATLSAEERQRVTSHCRFGSKLPAILAHATEHRADLIVMGTSGAAGISKYILGSTANKTLRQASCPVLCVPSSEARRFEKILVGTDFSECSRHALSVSAALATACDARLVVAHVSPSAWNLSEGLNVQLTGATSNWLELLEREAREQLDGFVERARHEGLAIQGKALLLGSPAQSLLHHAESQGFDLIVLGTHGRSGPSRLMLGSVAETVVHHAAVPVLAVRDSTRDIDVDASVTSA